MKSNRGSKYFILIKTVSSHHPFVNPENGRRSEAETLMYVDKQIAMFFEALKAEEFFENGILLIVGDHHSMIPLKREELDLFGWNRAPAKVPLIISYGDKKQAIVQDKYQQLDIFSSLKNLVSDKYCYSNWVGNLIGEDKWPAKYIAFRRGDERNTVSIFTNDGDISVVLNGDKTRVRVKGDMDESVSKMILNKINAVRILRSRK